MLDLKDYNISTFSSLTITQPSVSDHELAARLFHSLPRWLNDGFVKPNHPRVLKGGLQAVTDGFEKDRSEGPLDYKIVYQI